VAVVERDGSNGTGLVGFVFGGVVRRERPERAESMAGASSLSNIGIGMSKLDLQPSVIVGSSSSASSLTTFWRSHN
jgi:hypothetical protein